MSGINSFSDYSSKYNSNIDYSALLGEKKKYNMANQLFRSGILIGANMNEARNCETIGLYS